MNALARQYSQNGVVVLAINVEGSPNKYRTFVDQNGYNSLVVARDTYGEIASDYKVRGIPMTYVLDTTGLIRHVHVGYGSGLGDTMAQEIESLLRSSN